MPDTSNDGLINPLSRVGFRPARPSSDAYFSRDSKYTQWEILSQACLARRGTNLADVQQQERYAKSCCGNQKSFAAHATQKCGRENSNAALLCKKKKITVSSSHSLKSIALPLALPKSVHHASALASGFASKKDSKPSVVFSAKN
jgi:hypothetical protein